MNYDNVTDTSLHLVQGFLNLIRRDQLILAPLKYFDSPRAGKKLAFRFPLRTVQKPIALCMDYGTSDTVTSHK
jgi:hypothetical protein